MNGGTYLPFLPLPRSPSRQSSFRSTDGRTKRVIECGRCLGTILRAFVAMGVVYVAGKVQTRSGILAYFFTRHHWLWITVELHNTTRATRRLMLGRGVATPLSTEIRARNHAALEHIDVVVGYGRSGVPLSSTRLHQ